MILTGTYVGTTAQKIAQCRDLLMSTGLFSGYAEYNLSSFGTGPVLTYKDSGQKIGIGVMSNNVMILGIKKSDNTLLTAYTAHTNITVDYKLVVNGTTLVLFHGLAMQMWSATVDGTVRLFVRDGGGYDLYDPLTDTRTTSSIFNGMSPYGKKTVSGKQIMLPIHIYALPGPRYTDSPAPNTYTFGNIDAWPPGLIVTFDSVDYVVCDNFYSGIGMLVKVN